MTRTQIVYSYAGDLGTTLYCSMSEASDGTRGTARFKKWETCPMCSMEFPADQFARVNGKRLCVPNGCYKDGEVGR
jgi:hypothetical protein